MRVISGKKRGLKLLSPKDDDVRPTTDKIKESIFNILDDIEDNSVVLDLFAGTGSVGIEFLSRGADKVYFCDCSSKSISVLKENIKKTDFEDDSIVVQKNYIDALKYFSVSGLRFDYIFLDPPYETDYVLNALDLIHENDMLNEDGIIIFETMKDLEIENFEVVKEKRYGKINVLFLMKE